MRTVVRRRGGQKVSGGTPPLILRICVLIFVSKNFSYAKPISIADEVDANLLSQRQHFGLNSRELEQYREAMQIARGTFLTLKPLVPERMVMGNGSQNLDGSEKAAAKRRRKIQQQRKRQRQHLKQQQQQRSAQINGEAEKDSSSPSPAPSPPLHSSKNIFLLTPLGGGVNTNSSSPPASSLRSDTCQGDLFKHKIRVPGCKTKTITNRFCHGTCSSFYIPRLRSKKLKATFQSCAACIPAETDTVQVSLECPGLAQGELYRTVVRVKKCACRNIKLEGEEMGEEEEEENDLEGGGEENEEEDEEIVEEGDVGLKEEEEKDEEKT